MKILSTLFLSFFLVFGMQAQEEDSTIQKQVRKMGSFDRVKASKGVNVTLIEGEKESVEVHIKNGELSDVITELDSRQLVVKMKTKIYKGVAVQVYVTYKTIREVETGSGGSIDAENTIYADKLKIKAGADSSIELDVDVNAVEASGNAARIELSGVCNVQEVNMGTGGKYYSYPLDSKEAVVKATLGSTIEITVKEKLNSSTSTGGSVTYKGEPAKIEIKGKVQEAEE
nr:head GIN domain-containing protein [uncultured Carboxylicivirga sp.]